MINKNEQEVTAKIVELSKTGISRKQIAKQLGVTEWRVRSAQAGKTCTTKAQPVSTRKIRRLFYDIETSYNIVKSWRIGYNQTIQPDDIIQERAIICMCYKWEGEDLVHVVHWEDGDDRAVVERFIELTKEATELVGHNLDQFDTKFMLTRAIKHGIQALPKYVSYDTLDKAKKHFMFNSNKLDYIAKYLGFGGKLEHEGMKMWDDIVLRGDKKALERMIAYCITPDHKLLGEDLRWRTADSFKEGESILGFDEKNQPRRKFRKATIEKIAYDNQEVFEVTLSSGKVFKVTKEHLWLVRNGNSYKWLETNRLRCDDPTLRYNSKVTKIMDMWEEDDSKDAGWLAGMFDGEGCLSFRGKTRAMTSLSISQNPGITYDKIETLLSKYAPYISRTTNPKTGSKCMSMNLYGTKADKLKFLGTIRPERLISKIDFDNLGAFESRGEDDTVVSVKSIGVQKIIQIQTSTGTFICDGYAHHNCQKDVLLTEEVFNKLRLYTENNTHHATADGGPSYACPNCKSIKVTSTKSNVSKIGSVKRVMLCSECNQQYTISNTSYLASIRPVSKKEEKSV